MLFFCIVKIQLTIKLKKMKSTIKQSAVKRIGVCIQKLSMFVFVSGAFVSAHAQVRGNVGTVVTHKEINRSPAFENVEVRGDIVVFLTNEKSDDVTLQGESKDVNAVTIAENDNTLEINATKAKSASNLVVYLPAAKIHSLKINGNAKVFSSGDVLVDDLAITVKGNSIVKVYHYGKLTITPGQGYELADIGAAY